MVDFEIGSSAPADRLGGPIPPASDETRRDVPARGSAAPDRARSASRGAGCPSRSACTGAMSGEVTLRVSKATARKLKLGSRTLAERDVRCYGEHTVTVRLKPNEGGPAQARQGGGGQQEREAQGLGRDGGPRAAGSTCEQDGHVALTRAAQTPNGGRPRAGCVLGLRHGTPNLPRRQGRPHHRRRARHRRADRARRGRPRCARRARRARAGAARGAGRRARSRARVVRVRRDRPGLGPGRRRRRPSTGSAGSTSSTPTRASAPPAPSRSRRSRCCSACSTST